MTHIIVTIGRIENALVVVAVIVLGASYRYLLLSRISYTLIFIFLCLHEIGAHYTYAEVPYDAWFMSLTGVTLNDILGWERNNFDRVIHLGYGLLLAYPVREVFLRIANVSGFWGYFLPLILTMSTSMMLTALLNVYLQRDFAQEWGESLRVKNTKPLGEDEIARLWLQRQ